MPYFPVFGADAVTSVNGSIGAVVISVVSIGAATPANITAATSGKAQIVALTGLSTSADIVTALKA